MIFKKTLFIPIIVLSILLLAPPVWYFAYNFQSYLVSDDIADWASFGDYFGGTVNTAISLLSLIVLSYLTYLISAQSNVENKNLNILLRRLDAYDKLTAFFPELNQFLKGIKKSVFLISKQIEEKNIVILAEEKKEFYKKLKFFSDFYYFLFSFNVRFGHLFQYSFSSEEYERILKNASILNTHFESAQESFEYSENKLIEYDNEVAVQLFDDLAQFINSLRKELN